MDSAGRAARQHRSAEPATLEPQLVAVEEYNEMQEELMEGEGPGKASLGAAPPLTLA